MQAFDAPCPVVQANAVYLCSSMLALSEDQCISPLYCNQVTSNFQMTNVLLSKTYGICMPKFDWACLLLGAWNVDQQDESVSRCNC